MNKARQPIGYAESLRNFCDAVLNDNKKVAVYSNNYRGAHRRALQNIYLTVQHYLDANIFSALALVYAQHYPPTHWDLNIYGEDFAELLAAQTQSVKAKEADWALLATLARIEYAISRVYYGYTEQYEQIPPHPQAINGTDFVSQLQKQHPYTKIADNLDINRTMRVLQPQTDSKIYIDNGSTCEP